MKIIKNIFFSILLLISNLIISMENNNQEDKIKDLYKKFEDLTLNLKKEIDNLYKLNNFILDRPEAISKAIRENNEEVLDILLKDHHIDPNINLNANNETPLLKACSTGNLNIVKKLIESGANIEIELKSWEYEEDDYNAKTIFYFATNLNILKYLSSS